MDSGSSRELNDDVLSEEIRLLGELVLAASSVTRHLTQDEVDQVLEQESVPLESLRPAAVLMSGTKVQAADAQVISWLAFTRVVKSNAALVGKE